MGVEFLVPDWPVPKNIKAVSTTRFGGLSKAQYGTFNLAQHVGDSATDVMKNRTLLNEALQLTSSPVWLNQTHGTNVLELGAKHVGITPNADASFTRQSGVTCVVMTADCLPILLCNASGTMVSAVHAGWRGLLNGVLENAVSKFPQADDVFVWLGPAIGPARFEVGKEVEQAFVEKHHVMAQAFRPSGTAHFHADLYALARMTLLQCGVKKIYGGEHCTYNEADEFFSYRRDTETGRMASLIWLQP
jgi:hypothetical protein